MDPNKIYRRSLYTFWKRTAPPPQMNLFGRAFAGGSASSAGSARTPPMQALALMNDAAVFHRGEGVCGAYDERKRGERRC